MAKFREHRSSYVDSMNTVVEVADFDALASHLRHLLEPYSLKAEDVEVRQYGHDGRCGWDMHIVSVKGIVVGFTDGPLERRAEVSRG